MLNEAGESPLGPPQTDLWRPGEWALDGPFSLAVTGSHVEATRLDRVRLEFVRRAGPMGARFFPLFLCTSKERGVPACNLS